ncbi:Nucleobase-ascorbate transporter 7 [Hibiscus syriacus]|uniref:Nucleobase-ascorbate transporter 7 n=1 Tax=Hibiscus syriacus TaxID=106335 RepID=A0A6A3CUC7_HIBSY|nr:Nucleobase-ascorbate transporter 7 [Hibiscus syriacus]
MGELLSRRRGDAGHTASVREAREDQQVNQPQNTVRFTCVKLLWPTETLTLDHAYHLTLDHAYRLITSQDVMKVMRAKKIAKTKRESIKKLQHHGQENLSSRRKSDAVTTNQEHKHERQSSRKTHVNAAAMRTKSWRPSSQRISEAAS